MRFFSNNKCYIEEVLTDFINHNNYLECRSTNQPLTFDFSDVEDSIII